MRGGLLGVLVPLLACAPAAPESGTGRASIVGGLPDAADPAVVALVPRLAACGARPEAPLCTGVLVAPRVVLTAAHCLAVFPEPTQYEVLFGASLTDPAAQLIPVLAAEAHPAYEPVTHAFDAALLRLAFPAGPAPVPLPSAPLGDTDVGALVRAVGFGETLDPAAPPGHKRHGTLRIDSLSTAAFRAVPAPAMSCQGDSGGPVLLARGGGAEEVVGITAKGDPACRAEAIHVRADAIAAGFVAPFLAATEAAPLMEPGTAERLGALCRAPCASDRDCPEALSCLALEDGSRRCGLPSLQDGDLLQPCARDAECGRGQCARVGSGSCRCFAPCARSCGCQSSGALAGLALVPLLARFAARRRPPRVKRLRAELSGDEHPCSSVA